MNLDYGRALSEGKPVPSIGRPDQLGVASPFDDNAMAQTELLTHAGLSIDISAVHSVDGNDADAVVEWLEASSQRHCLIFWQSPVTALALAMANNVAPTEAMTDWLAGAEVLMGVVRRNHHRTTLVETALAHAHPDLLVERLNQRFGLSSAMSDNDTASFKNKEATTLDAHNPVEVLIAKHAVVSDPVAHRLFKELRATSLPLVADESDVLPDPLTAWKAHRQLNSVSDAGVQLVKEGSAGQSNDLRHLKEENDFLLHQLHQVQEELESYYLQNRDIQRKCQEVEAERKKLQRECKTALQRAGMLQHKIDGMRNSRSWRLTKPLRAGNVFKRWKG